MRVFRVFHVAICCAAGAGTGVLFGYVFLMEREDVVGASHDVGVCTAQFDKENRPIGERTCTSYKSCMQPKT